MPTMKNFRSIQALVIGSIFYAWTVSAEAAVAGGGAAVRPGQLAAPCAPLVATNPPSSGSGTIVGSAPTVATANIGYSGPTPNITAVANAFSLRAKSLTTQITFRNGVTVSKPVRIMIDYASPAGQYRVNPIAYDNCNGHRFMYNDPMSGAANTPGYAIWGKPRQLAITITFSEDNPAGQPYVYSIPLKVNLDPLFDVAITPLRFKLNTSCESFYRGDADIHFLWYAPDAPKNRERSFQASKGNTVTINEFAWARQEASASAKLMFPTFSFYEKDWNLTSPLQYDIPKPQYPLLPASGGFVGRTLKDSSGQANCSADIAFDMNIAMRQYPNL